MNSILQNETIDKLPVKELQTALEQFLQPGLSRLPDQRLRAVEVLAVQGILSSQSPLLTQMARGVAHAEQTISPTAKRFYRFIWNERFGHRDLLKGLYGLAQRTVAEYQPPSLVVAIDPVNFEKPYTEQLEGVSTVMKSTPPPSKRLTPGYPAITATVVNLPEPVVTYANWFSYETADFVSENREIYRAIRTTRALFPHRMLRFLGDAGLDDQKIFHQVDRVQGQFTIRACHDRNVEVYNERLDRWEKELLFDLTASVPLPLTLAVTFTHARKVRQVVLQMGWLSLRLPETRQRLWAVVAHTPGGEEHDLVLLSNIPVGAPAEAEAVYTEWRTRPQIEHTYRFDQEQGLDVEDMRVQTLERMRRVFVLVLLATLFVYHVAQTWPHQMVLWLRNLGGKLGLSSDRDGPYTLLAGISAVFVTVATLAFAARHPFPRAKETYG